jgi:hypothetical protein
MVGLFHDPIVIAPPLHRKFAETARSVWRMTGTWSDKELP